MSRCNKCKKDTDSVNKSVHRTIRGNLYVKSKCKACDTTKSTFVKTIEGEGLSDQEREEMYEHAEFAHESYEPHTKRKDNYFPIQKLEKIFPNNSSLVTSPVISPKWYKACLISIASKSPVRPIFKPS